MRKGIIAIALLAAAIALAGCGGAPAAPATPTTIAQPIKASGKIVAEGKVVPVKSANLSMAVGGIASEVMVGEGAKVSASQPLVRLVSTQAQASIATAQASVTRAQAARQKLFQGPADSEINAALADLAKAQAALKQAQAAYDRAGGASNPFVGMLPTSLDLEQAYNDYDAAKARLETLQKPPRPAEIASADADIAVAQADLDKAKAALTEMELRAPFTGTISTVDIDPGEEVAAGTEIIRLADFSTWEIQTTDLTEINVVRIKVGDTVSLSFDAIPDLDMTGKVSRISSLGENRQGDIVYTVSVQPEKMDERLRWNMTAKVSIEPKP